MPITINITSDFICPWCLLGTRRLFRVLDELSPRVMPVINWLPYELNPNMPAEGMDRKTYRTLKFGSWRRALELDAGTIAAGAADGVVFDYERIQRVPNTFAAHRLAWLAAQTGQQNAVAHAIQRGYFVEGRDIGSWDVLADLAAEAGLNRTESYDFLSSGAATLEVRHQEQRVLARGVRGIPRFTLCDKIITGLQPPAFWRETILAADEKSRLSQPEVSHP